MRRPGAAVRSDRAARACRGAPVEAAENLQRYHIQPCGGGAPLARRFRDFISAHRHRGIIVAVRRSGAVAAVSEILTTLDSRFCHPNQPSKFIAAWLNQIPVPPIGTLTS